MILPYRTSGMVIELSAMFVAKMIFQKENDFRSDEEKRRTGRYFAERVFRRCKNVHLIVHGQIGVQRDDVVVLHLTLIQLVRIRRQRIGFRRGKSQRLVKSLNFQETRQKDQDRRSFDRQVLRVIPAGHAVFVVEALDQFHR